MSGPLKIDTHLHLYATSAEGEWWKSGYEIWEYGQRDGVHFSNDTGTLDETVAALSRGGFAHGVVLNLFAAGLFREQYGSALPPEMDGAGRAQALADFDATVSDALKSPDVVGRFGKIGADIVNAGPTGFTERLKSDQATWNAVIQQAGLATQ